MYNGIPADLIRLNGSERLGVHNMKDGLFTRGVLVDMAWMRGVDFLEPGHSISASDTRGLGGKNRHHHSHG